MLNALMFGVEFAGGLHASSASLIADAVDFFGDAANYGLSLAVLALAPIWRTRTAMIKGVTMGVYGVFVLAHAAWQAASGNVPSAITMSGIALAAVCVNLLVAVLLYSFRNGDANMRSVWLCTRNDVIGNIAVMFAAWGVAGTGTAWPDIAVACIMGTLGLSAARTVIGQAQQEMRTIDNLGPSAKRVV
jgi:Co/Zn/Cd efflux system component